MDFSDEAKLTEEKVKYIGTNQDQTNIAVSTSKGYRIYTWNPFSYKLDVLDKAVTFVQTYYQTNLVCYITSTLPQEEKKLKPNSSFKKGKIINLYDLSLNKIISQFKFKSSIRNMVMTRDKIFVVFKRQIFIFMLFTFENIDFFSTYDNPKGVFGVNENTEKNTIVAYLDSGKGLVRIRNYNKRESILIMVDENSSINNLSLNKEGSLLGIACQGGTIIKIFDTSTGECIQTLKRGFDKANINYICFDPNSILLAVCSSKGTLHVWSIFDNRNKSKEFEDCSVISPEKSIMDSLTNEYYTTLPRNNSSIFNKITFGKFSKSEKSFAKMHLNEDNFICKFINNTNEILVVCESGNIYLGIIDMIKGGEIKLKKKENLRLLEI